MNIIYYSPLGVKLAPLPEQYDAHVDAYYWHMQTVGDDRCLPWGYRERFVVEV